VARRERGAIPRARGMVAQGKGIHSDKKAIAGIRGNPQKREPKKHSSSTSCHLCHLPPNRPKPRLVREIAVGVVQPRCVDEVAGRGVSLARVLGSSKRTISSFWGRKNFIREWATKLARTTGRLRPLETALSPFVACVLGFGDPFHPQAERSAADQDHLASPVNNR
jgi:hypothetical protein